MLKKTSTELQYPVLQLYINGEWVGAQARKVESVISPLTEEKIGDLPHATQADLEAAVVGARAAFQSWSVMSALERSAILRRAADLIRERADTIAGIMTLEQGKTRKEARMEVLASAETFDWYAEEGRRTYGRVVPGRTPQQRITVMHQPVGVCVAFTPWNFPSITPARKMAGALAAGCTLVIKLAEETPATGLELVRALHDAGLPPGAINAVFGVPAEVSSYLLSHQDVAKFSFTGSTVVGKLLAQQAAKDLKRATMELGGHAPVIVCEDADIDQAVAMLVAGKFRNAGQVCIAPTRFYIHRDVYDEFTEKFVQRVQALRLGDGLDEQVDVGPLANPRRVKAMEELIQDAVEHGATIACGGKRGQTPGFFWQPTVLENVPDSARIMNEEPFGPVALLRKVDSVDEAIEHANRLPYGLASYAFTRDSLTRSKLSRGIQAGMLGINSLHISMPEAPFGGIKESGLGSECGIEGLLAYCNVKLVSED